MSAAHVGLVLSGGGARAAYQVGVLCALTERAPSLTFPIITGVSAGAINALYLAAHPGAFAAAAAALHAEWSRLRAHDVYRAISGVRACGGCSARCSNAAPPRPRYGDCSTWGRCASSSTLAWTCRVSKAISPPGACGP
jgi:patatin-like phospholipase